VVAKSCFEFGERRFRRLARVEARDDFLGEIDLGVAGIAAIGAFALQARDPSAGALERARRLTAHPAFDAKTPNRLRALVLTFAAHNPDRFHDPGGQGYRFLADQILAVDAFNPMTAARLIEPLGSWSRYTP